MKPRISTVITDLDNTLYDWVEMWGAAFSEMLRVLVEQSGVPQHVIHAEARVIHQEHGTTEYAFLIQSLPCLQAKHPGQDLTVVYGDAIRAYRDARERSLRLYPSVFETLVMLKSRGCLVIGYTDSRAFYAGYRARKLGLDGLLDLLHSPPDHDLPASTAIESIRSQPREAYEFQKTVHRLLPEGAVKPNPVILANILEDVGAVPEETIYIGDSLMKDVLMAQETRVTDVFAKYGQAQHRDEYDLLRRVSHWTDAEIEREKRLRAQQEVHPTYTLNEGFREVLDLFVFGPPGSRSAA